MASRTEAAPRGGETEGVRDTLPDVFIEIPVLTNRWTTGLAFQVHLVFVAAIMGASILAPTAQIIGWRRPNSYFPCLARDTATVMVRFFAFGATWAVVAIVLLVALYPVLMGVLMRLFFWPLVLIAVMWILMTTGAYVYGHFWESLSRRPKTHNAFGWLFAISTTLFIALITNASSFQLTPDSNPSGLSGLINSTWLPELAHRLIGNMSYLGLILAGISAWRLLFDRGGPDREYYDWLGNLGLMLGIGFMLLQPLGGAIYANQVRLGAPESFRLIMTGEYSWLFLIQSILFGATFFSAALYMARSALTRAEPRGFTRALLRWAPWGMLAATVLIAIPRQLPLGAMVPWKFISLSVFVVLGAAVLIAYLRLHRSFTWGQVTRGSQWALLAAATAVVLLMITMGVIRSSARGGDLINERLGPEQAQQIEVR